METSERGTRMQGKEIIRLDGLTKWYEDGRTVLDHINLTVRRNEFLTLLGPSGCGKTTLLYCLNALIKEQPGAQMTGDVVLSGVSTVETIQQFPYRPMFILNGVGSIIGLEGEV